ncbi:uncharacterized protein LOC135492142 [Lineus longissimus]|uniref:uncharacterized protein LOC135492142 n=1 Tax=Lineus longissimus TaxID=88925 RepID=UPI002B4C2940
MDFEIATTPVQAEIECQPKQNASNDAASYTAKDCSPSNETIDKEGAEKCQYYEQCIRLERLTRRQLIMPLIGSDFLFKICVQVYAQVSDELSEIKFDLKRWHKINSVKHLTYEKEKTNLWKGWPNYEFTERTVWTGNQNENIVNQEKSEIQLTYPDNDKGSPENSNTSAANEKEFDDEIHDENVIHTEVPLDDVSGGEYYEEYSVRCNDDDGLVDSRDTSATDEEAVDEIHDANVIPTEVPLDDVSGGEYYEEDSVRYIDDDCLVDSRDTSATDREAVDEIHDANVIPTEVPLDDVSGGEYYEEDSVSCNDNDCLVDSHDTSATDREAVDEIHDAHIIPTEVPLDDVSGGEYYEEYSVRCNDDDCLVDSHDTSSTDGEAVDEIHDAHIIPTEVPLDDVSDGEYYEEYSVRYIDDDCLVDSRDTSATDGEAVDEIHDAHIIPTEAPLDDVSGGECYEEDSVRCNDDDCLVDSHDTSATDREAVDEIHDANVIPTEVPLDDVSGGEYYEEYSVSCNDDDCLVDSHDTSSTDREAVDEIHDANVIPTEAPLDDVSGGECYEEDSVRCNDDDCLVDSHDTSATDGEAVDEIHDANVIPTEVPLDEVSGGEYYEEDSVRCNDDDCLVDNPETSTTEGIEMDEISSGEEDHERDTLPPDYSLLGYDDTMYKRCSTWCKEMMANDTWELTCPKDDYDHRVLRKDVDEVEWYSQVDEYCNIVDGCSVTDPYKSNCPMMSGMDTQDPRRVYLFQEPDGTTSINVVQASAASDGRQSFSSGFLLSCLALVAFMQNMKKKVPSNFDIGVNMMKSSGTWPPEKTSRPHMAMKDIAMKAVAWLLIGFILSIAAASSPNYTANTLKNELIDFTSLKGGFLGLKRVELKNILCDQASQILRKAAAPLEGDIKTLSTLHWENPWKLRKKDFLKDVLNIPDWIQLPLQIIEVCPVFERRGYEDEFTRLASFSRCPEERWLPAVPLAENGFYFEPESSVVCNFCKNKMNTWQNSWDPKQKHVPNCPFLNGNDCGNIRMEPSREIGTYQPAIQSTFDELQIPQLQNKNKVLLRNSTRSVESFKNPQLQNVPENQMGSLSINVTQGQGQEDDAMEDEPQPSTSNSNSSQQQQEGGGGLRYFVHSYDKSGRPISTSQKMEFNSTEEKANASMKKEADRLESFNNVWKKGDVISPEELAKSGFYYAGTGDRVRCAFCNGVLRNWAVGDRAPAEHRRHYPTCPFVLNLNVGNVPSSQDLSGLQTSTAATTNHSEQKRQAAPARGQQSAQSSGPGVTPPAIPGTILMPKHSNFRTVESRLLTYDNWPSSNVQRPNELAEAGFFFTGANDNVRCFHCDGGLRNWLDSDLPWIEHAKWFPRCGFLQRAKGVEFVLEETRKHNQQNVTTAVAQNRGSTGMTTTTTHGVGIVERPTTGVRRVEAREVRARFDTDSVKMVLDMGYKEAVVKYVILERLRYTGDDFPSTQEMLESVLAEDANLEEKGIAYYENILQQEFGRPMTIVYPQLTGIGGQLDNTAGPSPAPPMTQMTSASLEIPGDEKSLVEENRQLKEQTTCKICMDNEVSMVFVPCGHLVACADCAPNLRECPICRRPITGTIRTFLS